MSVRVISVLDSCSQSFSPTGAGTRFIIKMMNVEVLVNMYFTRFVLVHPASVGMLSVKLPASDQHSPMAMTI